MILLPELLKEKILIHPTRLVLFKLLEFGFPENCSELRDQMGITWGEFSNHSKILSRLGYVSITKQFENGSLKQKMRLTHEGMRKYQHVMMLLREYIEIYKENLD